MHTQHATSATHPKKQTILISDERKTHTCKEETMSNTTPPPSVSIPENLRNQQGQAGAGQRLNVAEPRLLDTFDPIANDDAILPNSTNPPVVTLVTPTLLDTFDPTGITPSYHTLLAAMDYVGGTSIWVTYEDFLLRRGFGVEFWTVVGANTNKHLGLRRAELLETMTWGVIRKEMIGDVAANWEFVWRAATWMAAGGDWQDIGPVRRLIGC
ncbi:hypothetical protein EDC01DRAFT_484909 [Geopyxis carbonaria]|nr:hypothetical protein EDC01DRAFT_484909 [Geopyxis carbonaria]